MSFQFHFMQNILIMIIMHDLQKEGEKICNWTNYGLQFDPILIVKRLRNNTKALLCKLPYNFFAENVE